MSRPFFSPDQGRARVSPRTSPPSSGVVIDGDFEHVGLPAFQVDRDKRAPFAEVQYRPVELLDETPLRFEPALEEQRHVIRGRALGKVKVEAGRVSDDWGRLLQREPATR